MPIVYGAYCHLVETFYGVLVSYDVKNKHLIKKWCFDSNKLGNSKFASQGFHNLAVADCDGDGFDEIVYGSCVIDHDGTCLFSTGLGHGDALHVGDLDPSNEGQEAWGCLENGEYSAALWDLNDSGCIIFKEASGDNRRRIAGNFLAANEGSELASYASDNLYDTAGNIIGKWSELVGGDMNFTCYWDGDLEHEALDDIYVYKDGEVIFTDDDIISCNGTKNTPCLCADILGDWREEIIWSTTDGCHIRIYSTTELTDKRLCTLMHNTQYRCQVASQNVGYNSLRILIIVWALDIHFQMHLMLSPPKTMIKR